MTASKYRETEARIQQAKEAYLRAKKAQENTKNRVTVKSFAESYDVPYDRLRCRINGVNSRSTRPRTNQRLDRAQYETLYQYIDRLDHARTAPTPQLLRKDVNEILKRNHENPFIKPPTISKNWPYRFLKLHPEYTKKKVKKIDPKRSDAERIEDIRGWFGELDIIMEAYGIQEGDIYNMDETGFRLGEGKDENTISRADTKQAKVSSSYTRILVTILECIGIDGQVLPPFIIMPGKRHMVNWYAHVFYKRIYITLIYFSEIGMTVQTFRINISWEPLKTAILLINWPITGFTILIYTLLSVREDLTGFY